jgi:hypothetical protein
MGVKMKNFKNFIKETDDNNLGSPNYSSVKNASKDEPSALYQTAKGSTYAHYSDSTSIRDKLPRPEHPGEQGIQPRSRKTIFMNPEDVNRVAGIHQNAGMGTSFVPHPEKQNTVVLQHSEDYGPRKKGEYVRGTEAPFSLTPSLGMHPVEIMNPHSPKGVHFGNAITHIERKY